MRIFLILALIFCLGFQHSIAQNNNIKPLAEISNKAPDVESMKRKDLQRELLNYYSKAIILHSQIVAINEYPAVSVPGLPDPLPTKSSILRSEVLKYFEIAKKLQNQILTTEYQNTYELQNQIRKLQEEKDRDSKILKLAEFVTTADLANLMGISPSEIILKCMGLGLMVTINQRLDKDTITKSIWKNEAEIQESFPTPKRFSGNNIQKIPIYFNSNYEFLAAIGKNRNTWY